MRTCFAMFLSLCVIAVMTGCREETLMPYSQGNYDYHGPQSPAVMGPGPGVSMGAPAAAPAGVEAPEAAAMKTSQVAFVGPAGATIRWDVTAQGMFDSEAMVCPGRQNFPQGGIYRLKLTNIPGHPGLELYPTLEVAPAMPRTQAFLAHSMVPVNITEEDLMQVRSGNFVTKVIYLPDPEFQELALAVGTPDTIVSTRLDPGVDPIAEADRRGAILAIIRIGNKIIEPETAVMDSVSTPAAGTAPSSYVSGVTGPEYGTPITQGPAGQPGAVALPSEAKSQSIIAPEQR